MISHSSSSRMATHEVVRAHIDQQCSQPGIGAYGADIGGGVEAQKRRLLASASRGADSVSAHTTILRAPMG